MTKALNKTADTTPDPAEAPAREAARSVWLVARTTDEHGPAGSFAELTEDEARLAPEGVLVKPTREQLALRVG